jgi:hypothetical protein
MVLKSSYDGKYWGDAKNQFRLQLPYGKWTCKDGREVFFDRKYCPVCERRPGQLPQLADPTEWVRDIVKDDWIYHDGHDFPEKLVRAQAALKEWGALDMVTTHIKARMETQKAEERASRRMRGFR